MKRTTHNRVLQHSDSSFTRSSDQKQTPERILIVCEGKKTEKNYFDRLSRLLELRNIEVTHYNSAPISVVNGAISRKQEEENDFPFDEVWCVFDRDHHPTFLKL